MSWTDTQTVRSTSKNQLGVTRKIVQSSKTCSGVKFTFPRSAASRWARSHPKTRATASPDSPPSIRRERTCSPMSCAAVRDCSSNRSLRIPWSNIHQFRDKFRRLYRGFYNDIRYPSCPVIPLVRNLQLRFSVHCRNRGFLGTGSQTARSDGWHIG